jgi:hypothetical protein
VSFASPSVENGGVIADLLRVVAETLERTARVRIFDSAGPAEQPRKRRDRRPEMVFADEDGVDALTELRAALALRPDTQVMDWLCPPDLRFELLGHDDVRLTVLGVLYPDWIRWEDDGDLQLQDPRAIALWLARWAPDAVPTLAGFSPSDRR